MSLTNTGPPLLTSSESHYHAYMHKGEQMFTGLPEEVVEGFGAKYGQHKHSTFAENGDRINTSYTGSTVVDNHTHIVHVEEGKK